MFNTFSHKLTIFICILPKVWGTLLAKLTLVEIKFLLRYLQEVLKMILNIWKSYQYADFQFLAFFLSFNHCGFWSRIRSKFKIDHYIEPIDTFSALLLGWSFLSVLEMVIDFLDILIRKKLTVNELTVEEMGNHENAEVETTSLRPLSTVSSMLSVDSDHTHLSYNQ